MHYAFDVICTIVVRACELWYGSHPEVGGNKGFVHGNDHVITFACRGFSMTTSNLADAIRMLTYADVKYSRLVRDDWYQIRSHHSHRVIVNRPFEVRVDRGVDKTDTI